MRGRGRTSTQKQKQQLMPPFLPTVRRYSSVDEVNQHRTTVHCRQLHLHVMNAYNKDSMADETARRFSESSVTDTIITIRRTHRDTRENGSDKKIWVRE